jgi:hypothetical protein
VLDEWLRWKLPDAKERKRYANHVVMLVVSETSAWHSPKPITALSPFAFKSATVQQALTPRLQDTAAIHQPFAPLSVQPTQCMEALIPPCSRWEIGLEVLWKPPDTKEMRRRSGNVVKLEKKATGALHLPKTIMAPLPFVSKPAAVPQACIAPLLQDTAAIRQPVALLSVQPARCAEALLRRKTGLGIHWKLPDVRKRV